MNTTWILVANRAQARLFESTAPGTGLRLVRDIEHPEGRLTNHEMGSDRPRRAFHGSWTGTSPMSKEHDEAEQTAIRFAKQLSALLDEGRTQHQFAKLVLVAEPRFLGQLREALSRETAALVSASLNKDLPGVGPRDLGDHLADVMRV